jgi:hypothetical protein
VSESALNLLPDPESDLYAVAANVPDATVHRSGPFAALLSERTAWANFAVPVGSTRRPATVDPPASLTALRRPAPHAPHHRQEALAPALPTLERAGCAQSSGCR